VTSYADQRIAKLQSGEAYCDKALQLINASDLASALIYFDKAEELFLELDHPQWLTFTRHEKFRALVEGGQFEKAAALAPAIEAGYERLQDKRGLALFLIHRADLQRRQNAIPKALAWLRLAAALIAEKRLPEFEAYLRANLAVALMAQDSYYQAIENLQLVFADDSLRPWYHEQLGICYQKIFRFADAEREFNLSFEAYRSSSQWSEALGVLEQLRTLHEGRQDQQAVQRLNDLSARIRQRIEPLSR